MGKIEEIMSETLIRLGKRHDVTPNRVIVFIENKGNKIEYIYAIDKKIVKDESGSVSKLNFTKDVLNKKFDPIGFGLLTSHRLNSFFDAEIKASEGLEKEDLKLYVTSIDEDAKKIGTALFKGYTQTLRVVTLNDVIGLG